MTLTSSKNRYYVIGSHEHFPVEDGVIIYQGAAVGENGSGYSRPLVAGDPFQGFALRSVDNSAGGLSVDVDVKNRIVIPVTGASAITANDKSAVYASDDNTFTLTATGNSLIGYVSRWVSGTTCVVNFDAALSVFTTSAPGESEEFDAVIPPVEGGETVPGTTSPGTFTLHRFEVASDAEVLIVDLTNIDVECDLFIKHDGIAQENDYDYSSETSDRDEQIILTSDISSGIWYAYVKCFGGTSYDITVRQSIDVLIDGVSVDGHVGFKIYRFYKVLIPSGLTSASISLTNLDVDCDLYAKYGSLPNESDRDYFSENGGTSDELIEINSPSEGTLYISVFGYSGSSDFTIEINLT